MYNNMVFILNNTIIECFDVLNTKHKGNIPGFKLPPSKQNVKLWITAILLTMLFHHQDDCKLA